MDDSPTFRWVELDTVTSTNDYLRDFRPQRDVPLTLVTAEMQTAGRGAGTNRWESAEGKNLLFSLRLKLNDFPARDVFALSEVLALSLCDALCDIHEGFRIKWPNDIYFGHKKVAGTLIENDLQGKNVAVSIMGTGINVNQTEFLSDAPNPISLAQILGQELETRVVLQNVMFHFVRYRHLLQEEGRAELHALYLQRIYLWQEEASYEDANGTFQARITDIEPDGHLVLTDAEGRVRRYEFKEVKTLYPLSPTLPRGGGSI